MAITERKVFLQTLKNARSRVILLDRLKTSILDNTAVDLETVPFAGTNSTNLDEAIQCYIDYGELPISGKLNDFWKAYEQALADEEKNMETGICRRCGCNWITPCLDDDCGALSETYLETPIEDIELSVRTYNCLKRAGKNTLGDISSMTIDELKNIREINESSIIEVESLLKQRGLSLLID